MSKCFKLFFDAASGFSNGQEKERGTQYYLGLQVKGTDVSLVQFRFDGVDKDDKPRGHGAILHYSGIEQGLLREAPKLRTINSLRNLILFSVTAEEFKASEGFIDLLRENGMFNPYYFTRFLGANINRERNGRKPLRFDGSEKPDYQDDPCDHFCRASDSMPAVGVNCVYMALEILQKIVGIDLSKIHAELPEAWVDDTQAQVYDKICAAMVEKSMPSSLARHCMAFDKEGELLATFEPQVQAPSFQRRLQAA